MAVLFCLHVAGEVANGVVHSTDPEWNPLDILHRVSTFIHKTQQTKSTLAILSTVTYCLKGAVLVLY